MEKKIYSGNYPSAARMLIESDITSIPRQQEKTFRWAEGIDITYTLRNLTPANFQQYSDPLLLLAYQEMMRYNQSKWKFARFEVRLGRLGKGKDLPEVASFQCAMHDEPEVAVYGPGYEVPQRHFLYHKVQDILEIARRYQGKVNKQNPYRVVKLIISIREPYE
jgi:hypothetical protein